MGADVVVVGGGVAGLGVAWRAALAGLRVVVTDEHPGAAASSVAAGMLAPVTEAHYGEEALLSLNLASAKRWPAFAAELAEASGVDVGLRTEGTVAVAFDADDHRVLLDLHTFHQELGLASERLRSAECRALEPALSPSVRGGLLVTGDHQVDNRAVTRALLVAAERAGVELRREAVASVRVRGGRCDGVALASGDAVDAAWVVVAAGAWSARLPGLPEEARPPVRPVKGQIVRLRGAPLLGHSVRAVVEGSSVYVVPRADGEVVVGATVEEMGFDTTVTAGAVERLLRDALDVVPGLAELELAETGAGLRPGTPDNGPLIGAGALEGLALATGHYRHGFLLLPVTADALAALLSGGPPDLVVAPFGPGRFTAVPA